MLERWRPYFEGKETLMGCGGCPGGGGGRIAPTVRRDAKQLIPPGEEEAYAIIEYVGDHGAATSYRAPSGNIYRFSALPTERQKYILKEDVDHFLNFPEFRLRDPAAPKKETLNALS